MNVSEVSAALQSLQKNRARTIKSLNMIRNRLAAVVADEIGYRADMSEADRRSYFKRAWEVVEAVEAGTADSPIAPLIKATLLSVRALEELQTTYEKPMVKLAKKLPVAAWADEPGQRGFGALMLAVVVGETGDLASYANPGKVWRRMGCAPWSYGKGENRETLMGSTWRRREKKQNKLPGEEWAKFGYSPRRRSVAYLVGDCLVKLNQRGPYRTRWLEAKAAALKSHPEWDWAACKKCKGEGGEDCSTCGGLKVSCGHAHLHGMLLASKMLLRNLWCVWNNKPVIGRAEWAGPVGIDTAAVGSGG